MANVFQPDLEPGVDDGFRRSRDRIGQRAGAQRLGASVYRIPPGEAVCPYHWHAMEEELLLVLSGSPSLRTPDGWRELAAGEVVAFPAGEAGAHQIANRSGEDAGVLLISEARSVEVCGYPDSDKLGIFGPVRGMFRRTDAVDYYDGEAPPADIMPGA